MTQISSIKNIYKTVTIKIKFIIFNKLQITDQFKIIIAKRSIQNYLKTTHPLFNIFIRQHIRCTLAFTQSTKKRIHNYL
ncbi:hypothetical protein N037_04900 [Enterobacter sp. EGD-HP1]|nr:hypothetical protein N037_04900 [Enterobacter sp. EGD-HP1]